MFSFKFRRAIKDALNQQTYLQFKTYAEQQYPGNPDQVSPVLIVIQSDTYSLYSKYECISV